jgi:hypothetical protein
VRRLAVVLAIAILLTLCACTQEHAPEASYSTTQYSLSISDDKVVSSVDWVVNVEKDPERDFVILNFTDIQLGTSSYIVGSERMKTMIKALIEKVQPDLITMTGDMSYGCGPAIYGICSYIDSFGIPWAPIYGNHDMENSGMSPTTLAKVLNNYSNCLFKDGPVNLIVDPNYNVDGKGNYVVNVVEKVNDGFKVIKSLVFFNTCTEGITELQMSWYQDCMDSVQQYGEGGVVSSVAFMHIPLPEYLDAAYAAFKTWNVSLAETYTTSAWESGYENSFGAWHSGVDYRESFAGAADIFKSKGNDLVVCGHNHKNCYCIDYDGMTYLYALKTGTGHSYEEGMEGGTEIKISGTGDFAVQHCFFYDNHGCDYTPQSF